MTNNNNSRQRYTPAQLLALRPPHSDSVSSHLLAPYQQAVEAIEKASAQPQPFTSQRLPFYSSGLVTSELYSIPSHSIALEKSEPTVLSLPSLRR